MRSAPAPQAPATQRLAVRSVVCVVVLISSLVAACSDDEAPSGDGGAASGSTDVAPPEGSDASTGDVVVAGSEVRETLEPATADTGSGGAPASGSDASTTTIATVPETGVPGVDSGDEFCRAWSEFAGSFQALASATAAGRPSTELYRLDIGAAVVIASAVDTMDAALPPELEAERTAVIEQYVGPLGRRAVRVLDVAADTMDDDALETAGSAWLAALIARGVTDPDIEIDVPADVDTDLDAAAEQVAGAVPTLFEDPSLVTDVVIPRTVDYLTTRCPDQGVLGGLDIVSL